MTKKDIFNKIAEVTAEVCNVEVDDILNGSRKEDVVTARTICVFWCQAAGFSVESLLRCTDRSNPNSINSIQARFEDYWVNRFAFHILVKTVGKRLLDYAHSIDEDFDINIPISRISKFTGKY